MVHQESKQRFLRGFVFTLRTNTLYFAEFSSYSWYSKTKMQLTNYFVLLASLSPIMGFITEILLETVSFSTINLLKCINLLYLRIKSGCFYYMKKKRGQFKYWQLSQNSYFLSNSNYILSSILLFTMGGFSLIFAFIWDFWVLEVFFAWRGLHLFEKKKLTRIQIIFHIVPLQFFHLSLL